MKNLFILCLFIASSYSLVSFKAEWMEIGNPAVNGSFKGNLNYYYEGEPALNGESENKYRIDYTMIPNVSPIEVVKTILTPNSNPPDYRTLKYLGCGLKECAAERYDTPFPVLGYDSNIYPQKGSTVANCTAYTNPNATYAIRTLWIAGSDPTTGKLCKADFFSGKSWLFSNMEALGALSQFDIEKTWNCPEPTCNTILDIALVFDESGSVGTAGFKKEQEFAVAIAEKFNFGATGVELSLVLFSDTARVAFGFENNRATAISLINAQSLKGGYTCIGCGVKLARELFDARTLRKSVQKVMIVLTDGKNNRGTVGAGTEFNLAIDDAKADGIFMIGVGVAGYNINEVTKIADSPNQVFTAQTFNDLPNLINGLITQTCTIDLNANPCGSAPCRGFCLCGTCTCPSCDDLNPCTDGTCSQSANAAGCTWKTTVCDDGDACTTDSCDVSVGCVTQKISCNDGDACTKDTCDPKFGCSNSFVTCFDADPCTADSCDSNSTAFNPCVYTPINCDKCKIGVTNVTKTCPESPDADLCKLWSCNVTNGDCFYINKNCDNNNPCSIDFCNSTTGECGSNPVICDDADSCTTDVCVNGIGCRFTQITAKDCDDFNECTVDTLDSTVKGCCVYTNVTCENSTLCEDSTCDSVLGCRKTKVDCALVLNTTVDNCDGFTCGEKGCVTKKLRDKDECGVCDGKNACKKFNIATTEALIGAAALVLLILGIVLCILLVAGGAGGGIAFYKSQNGQIAKVNSNPLYVDSAPDDNPLYEGN